MECKSLTKRIASDLFARIYL